MPAPEVAHIIHSGAIGGGPRVVLSLVEHIPAGHLVATAGDGPLLHDARNLGAEVVRLPFTGKSSFALSAPYIVRIAKRVDIVHVHGQFAAFYAAPAARAAGARVVYTAHFPSFVTDAGPRTRARNWGVERVSCAAAHVTVACSEFMQREYLRRHLSPPARMITIYNGVSEQVPLLPACAVRDELRIPADHSFILGLGRFTGQKGFDVLIDAMPEIVRRYPRATLVLVGDGPDRSFLHHRAHSLGLDASIRFTGYRDDTADLLAAADVVAVPSRYDVFPLVPLEAMMAGRAIVVSDLPVLREAIDDHRTGLVTPFDPNHLANTLLTLIADPSMRARLGAAARIQAVERFGVRRMAAQYASLYERLLS